MAYLGKLSSAFMAVDDAKISASSRAANEQVKELVLNSVATEVKTPHVIAASVAPATENLEDKVQELTNENLALQKKSKNQSHVISSLRNLVKSLVKNNKQLSKTNEALRSEIESPLSVPSEMLVNN